MEDILIVASQDLDNWTNEERQSMKNIVNIMEQYKKLNKELEEVIYNDMENPIKIEKIRKQKELLTLKVFWKKNQGNLGMSAWEVNKPFGFRIVGYSDHDGYFTPGIGIFQKEV